MVDIRSTGVSHPVIQPHLERPPEQLDEIALEELLLLTRGPRLEEEPAAPPEVTPEQQGERVRWQDEGGGQGTGTGEGEAEASAFAIIDGEPVLVSGHGQAREKRLDPALIQEAYRSGALELVVEDGYVLMVPSGRGSSALAEQAERARTRRMEGPKGVASGPPAEVAPEALVAPPGAKRLWTPAGAGQLLGEGAPYLFGVAVSPEHLACAAGHEDSEDPDLERVVQGLSGLLDELERGAVAPPILDRLAQLKRRINALWSSPEKEPAGALLEEVRRALISALELDTEAPATAAQAVRLPDGQLILSCEGDERVTILPEA